ncbi:hypothetical protein Tco_0774964 [Tanacetum coccineum]|uniref:Reverse transcriptase domain-containing protein n=1 Tax=Tanacetum coccineum TaxID=301880 RepID=A0ABQ4ZU22_9ASTR
MVYLFVFKKQAIFRTMIKKTHIFTSEYYNKITAYNDVPEVPINQPPTFQAPVPLAPGLGSLPSNTIANPKGDVKAITTRSGVSYNGLKISSPPMENDPEVTKVYGATKGTQTSTFGGLNLMTIIVEPVVASKTKTNLLIPSTGNKEKLVLKRRLSSFKIIEILANPKLYFGPYDRFFASPSFTPFGGSDFLMEEIDEFLEHDDSIPPGVDGIYDSEGDTVYLEELLSVINSDPNLPPSPVCEINVPEKVKSSCEDPPILELKDLSSHLEYAFLEVDDKLPVIIAKNLKDKDKTALIKVLKSHKHAIAWKISDIKGIDPQFCTHKILMEENAKPVVQHQRRVNPKIYEVIKQEVIKLLDAGLIYPISDSPWFGIEVDKAKVDVIAKLPHPTTVKGIRSFLGHAGFYRFIQDFSKIARPMTHLLDKKKLRLFLEGNECIKALKPLR